MDQAAWNLCPVSGVVSGSACYYADDQTFTDLAGTTTVVIDDCPDGKCFLSLPHTHLCTAILHNILRTPHTMQKCAAAPDLDVVRTKSLQPLLLGLPVSNTA